MTAHYSIHAIPATPSETSIPSRDRAGAVVTK